MLNEFFVDIVSNASMDVYPDNNLSAFINRLPQSLTLDGEWVVALHEIIHPVSFKTGKVRVNWATSNRKDPLSAHVKRVFEYSESESVKDIIQKFNNELKAAYFEENKQLPKEVLDPPDISIVKVSDKDGREKEKVNYKFGRIAGRSHPVYALCRDVNFWRLLGFDFYVVDRLIREAILTHKYEMIAPYTPLQPEQGSKGHLVFIYSDIIHEHYVGDTFARVLRVIPLNKNSSETLHHVTFNTPYYYPVRMNQIQDIAIKICDEEGHQIKFKTGRVFLSLHFKRKETV